MKKNKRGASTLFLAIILSALILVETTYVAYVADLDRRLTYTRALKEQTEIYLASYDRQLFKSYGIYAFDSASINCNVFNSILAANGYEPGDVMYSSGMYSIDTETLRRSVAAFYSYRTTGVLFDRFSDLIISMIDQAGDGILTQIRDFTSSSAAGLLIRLINGGMDLSGAIETAIETLGLDESSPGVQYFLQIMSVLGAYTNDSPDFGNGFDPSDLSFVFDVLNLDATLFEYGTAFNENFNLHACLADYAANNFDCMLEEDTAINGTSFNAFHSDNESDSEYILTGLEGFAGRMLTDYFIFSCLFLRSLVIYLTDPTKAEIITAVADVLSLVITAVSAGSVALPPQVYQAVIVILLAEIEALGDLIQVLNGDSVPFVSIGDIDAVNLDYRDFLTLFMNYVPDDLLLTRMVTVLNRDFPDYVIGIDAQCDYCGSTLCYEGRYEYYQ